MADRIQFLVDQKDGFTRNRLPALYSDFAGLRASNPDGYAINATAWRHALVALVRGGMLPAAPSVAATEKSGETTAARSFFVLQGGDALLDALHSDRFKRPLALDAVVREAVADRALVPLDAFLHARTSVYSASSWAAWAVGTAVRLPWQAVSWGLRRVGSAPALHGNQHTPTVYYYGHGRLLPNQYVVLAILEEAAAAFVAETITHASPFDRVWSTAQFKRQFSAPGVLLRQDRAPVGAAEARPRLSDTDMDVLLAFLARDKNAIVYDGEVVKLRTATPTSSSPPNAITDEDRAVAQMREVLDALHHQVDLLNDRIDERTAAARRAVERGNRVSALAALKQKRQAETALAARFATLAPLEAQAAKLEMASDQVAVVAAMAASADALQYLNAQVGGAAGVEAVVERLRGQMDAADEIGQIIVDAGPTATSVVDEGELDDELAALEKQERAKMEVAMATGTVPNKAKETKEDAAEETRKRLESAGAVPSKTPAADDIDAMLEAVTTDSFRNLSLAEKATAEKESQPELA